jgi:predicted TIM-barrel fold metal-dependent hydrolase
LMKERLARVKVGPASDPSSDMGPIIDKANVARIDKMVEQAIAQGAKVVLRGGPITQGPLAKGAFYRPALLEVTNPTMAIFQEEVFGPVLTMMIFETEEERFGLRTTVSTGWRRASGRGMSTGRCASPGSSTPARSGSTTGPSFGTSSKRADSNEVATAASTARQPSTNFWSTSTSRSIQVSSRPQLAHEPRLLLADKKERSTTMEGKIALEEHFSTELNNSYWDSKGEESRNGKAYAEDIARRLLDPELCLREMDRAGIEVCILSLTSPGVQSVVDPRKASELARTSNDYVASVIKKHPDRFSAFAAVPLQEPKAAATELGRAVRELGFKGALVNGYSNVGANESVQYLDEEPVREFWECVNKLNVPVYLHPREPLPSQTRSIQGYPELVGSAWAFTYETASHAIRLMLSGLFDLYPKLKIILGHLGEGLPYVLPRLQHRLDEQFEGAKGVKARKRVSYYFANHFWLTTSGHYHTKPFLEAVEQIGEDRMLFSVDYPYEPMSAAARWFDEAEFSTSLKLKVGRENANRLLRLSLETVSRSAAASFGA